MICDREKKDASRHARRRWERDIKKEAQNDLRAEQDRALFFAVSRERAKRDPWFAVVRARA